MSILSGLPRQMFTMILLAYNKTKRRSFGNTGGNYIAIRKRTERADKNKAVDAYNTADDRFDPLGSYTGLGNDVVPCQDADDL